MFCTYISMYALCLLRLCQMSLSLQSLEGGCITVLFINANSRTTWNFFFKFGSLQQTSFETFSHIKHKILSIRGLRKFNLQVVLRMTLFNFFLTFCFYLFIYLLFFRSVFCNCFSLLNIIISIFLQEKQMKTKYTILHGYHI